MDRLAGKVVLITGAARGLGEAVARMAVAEGAAVVVSDVLDERGRAVAAHLGERAAYTRLDVREQADWAAAVELAESTFGHLDVLVNNAAVLRVGSVEDLPVEHFHEVVAVNQLGPFLGMQAVVPAMRRAGRGSIVNVGSTDAMMGIPGVVAYGGTKWALRGMTKIAAQDLGPHGIRVNSVHPGGIRTEMSVGVVVPGNTMAQDDTVKRWPIQRFPAIEEVAAVVVFLASDEATYTTGTDVTADGGATVGQRYV